MKESNKKRKAFARRLILVLIGLILGVNVYLANARGILGNALPMPFGYGIASVLSGSMEPEFSKGTLLLVKETTDVEVNDIIVYQSDNMLITHRVIERNGSSSCAFSDSFADVAPCSTQHSISGANFSFSRCQLPISEAGTTSRILAFLFDLRIFSRYAKT